MKTCIARGTIPNTIRLPYVLNADQTRGGVQRALERVARALHQRRVHVGVVGEHRVHQLVRHIILVVVLLLALLVRLLDDVVLGDVFGQVLADLATGLLKISRVRHFLSAIGFQSNV